MKQRYINGTNEIPIYELQLCYTYAENLKFVGVLLYDVTIEDWVIRSLYSDIRFQVSLLNEVYVCTSTDVSMVDTKRYLEFIGLST